MEWFFVEAKTNWAVLIFLFELSRFSCFPIFKKQRLRRRKKLAATSEEKTRRDLFPPVCERTLTYEVCENEAFSLWRRERMCVFVREGEFVCECVRGRARERERERKWVVKHNSTGYAPKSAQDPRQKNIHGALVGLRRGKNLRWKVAFQGWAKKCLSPQNGAAFSSATLKSKPKGPFEPDGTETEARRIEFCL